MNMLWIDDIKFYSRMNEDQEEKRSISTLIMKISPDFKTEEAYVEIRGRIYYILRWNLLDGLEKQNRIYDVVDFGSQGYSRSLIKDNLSEKEFESWLLLSQLPVF